MGLKCCITYLLYTFRFDVISQGINCAKQVIELGICFFEEMNDYPCHLFTPIGGEVIDDRLGDQTLDCIFLVHIPRLLGFRFTSFYRGGAAVQFHPVALQDAENGRAALVPADLPDVVHCMSGLVHVHDHLLPVHL